MKRELEMERNGNGEKWEWRKGKRRKGKRRKGERRNEKWKKGRREGVGEKITHFEATKNNIRKLVCHFFVFSGQPYCPEIRRKRWISLNPL